MACRRAGAEAMTGPSDALPQQPVEPAPQWVGRSYVRMRIGTQRTSFVFVHPVGGSVSGYFNVIAALPSSASCVGLRARGLDPHGQPDHDIPGMATGYLSELLDRHEAEHLVVCGYSFGGLVAFEMAHQLECRGRPPAGVVLLDTSLPRRDVSGAERVASFRQLISVIYRVPVERLPRDDLDDDDLVSKAVQAALRYDGLPAEHRKADLRKLFTVLLLNLRMAEQYAIPRYYGRVHLVRPETAPPHASIEDWSWHCPAGIAAHDVGGEHNSLMSGDHGRRIAGVLGKLWLE